MDTRKIFGITAAAAFASAVLAGGCATGSLGRLKAGEACRMHKACLSGVCSRYKKDYGNCAPARCTPGDKTDNNNFYCARGGTWRPSKRAGRPCSRDYQCYKPTCFMRPGCAMSDVSRTMAICDDGVCVRRVARDECERRGLKRVLRKDQFFRSTDGRCRQSLAQMELPTLCAPCGNGVCDRDVENECNCPRDCR